VSCIHAAQMGQRMIVVPAIPCPALLPWNPAARNARACNTPPILRGGMVGLRDAIPPPSFTVLHRGGQTRQTRPIVRACLGWSLIGWHSRERVRPYTDHNEKGRRGGPAAQVLEEVHAG
jgi:hypothetical protein